MTEARLDFFVSYNHADSEWAEWIAWMLEEAGYTTVIQAWDFRPGTNFVLEMDEAARRADRTIAVLSPDYLGSGFVAPEWAAAFAADPRGQSRSVVPVRVAPSHADGLLGQLVWIDLVGLSREHAKAALLAGLQPGRRKPVTEPSFPGSATGGLSVAPGSDAVCDQASVIGPSTPWRPLGAALTFMRRRDLVGAPNQLSSTVLEVHVLPVEAAHLAVLRLAEFGNELAELGRQAGMFSVGQAVDVQTDSVRAYARTMASRSTDDCGLAIARTGQRSAWIALPHDMLGAVYDASDIRPRLAALLAVLEAIASPMPQQLAFALHVQPLTMLSRSSVAQVGHRTNAQMPFVTREFVTVAPDDYVQGRWISSSAAAVADELTARLDAALQ